MGARWSINIPCGFTCGANSSGGDHFWVIASYLDVVDGAINVGEFACEVRLPQFGWLCSLAAQGLKTWARGWGSASNHGVWAAIYWWPPHWSGGRW